MHDVVRTPPSREEQAPALPPVVNASPVARLARRLRGPVNRWFARQSLVGDAPLIDPRTVAGLSEFAVHWQEVHAELRRLCSGEAGWRTCFFTGYGFRAETNHALCPNTSALLDGVPGLVAAFLSVMEPGTRVPTHRGASKAWLTCHLGIDVPEGTGECAIEVAGDVVAWREGQWLVFDESCPHAMWNDTVDPRVVLTLQVRRPMRRTGRMAADVLVKALRHTALGQAIKRNLAHR